MNSITVGLIDLPRDMIKEIVHNLDGRALIALVRCNQKTLAEISEIASCSNELCKVWFQQIARLMPGSRSISKKMINIAVVKANWCCPALAYHVLSYAYQQRNTLSCEILQTLLINTGRVAKEQQISPKNVKICYHMISLANNVLGHSNEKKINLNKSKINDAIHNLIPVICCIAKLKIYYRKNDKDDITLFKILELAVELFDKLRSLCKRVPVSELNRLIKKIISACFAILKTSILDIEQSIKMIQFTIPLIEKLKIDKTNYISEIEERNSYKEKLVESICPNERKALFQPEKCIQLLKLAISTDNKLCVNNAIILKYIVDLAFKISIRSSNSSSTFQDVIKKLQQPMDPDLNIHLLCQAAKIDPKIDALKQANILARKDSHLLSIVKSCCELFGQKEVDFAYEIAKKIEEQYVRAKAICLIAQIKPLSSSSYQMIEEIANEENIQDHALGKIAKTACKIAKREVLANYLESQRFYHFALKIATKTNDASLREIPYKVCKIVLKSDLEQEQEFAHQLIDCFIEKGFHEDGNRFDFFVQLVKILIKTNKNQALEYLELAKKEIKNKGIKKHCYLTLLEALIDSKKIPLIVETLLKLGPDQDGLRKYRTEVCETICKIIRIQVKTNLPQALDTIKTIMAQIRDVKALDAIKTIMAQGRDIKDEEIEDYAYYRITSMLYCITSMLCEMALEFASIDINLSYEFCLIAFYYTIERVRHLFKKDLDDTLHLSDESATVLQIRSTCFEIGKKTVELSKQFNEIAETVTLQISKIDPFVHLEVIKTL